MAGITRWRRGNDEVPRPHRVVVKLSDAEHAELAAAAAVRNKSIQALLMAAYRADSATVAARFENLSHDLLQARRTLANISGNVNQAVKLEHTRRLEGFRDGGQFEDELRAELGRLRGLIGMIEKIAKQAEA